MADTPRVSIIMPTYQRAVLLEQVVRTILEQDYADFELLVMDDGSTDSTATAMGSIPDRRLRYMRRPRLGVPAILNEGYRHVRGEYLMILHDHDEYAPTMLSSFVRHLDSHPTAAFVFCGLILVDSSGAAEVSRDVHEFPALMPGLRFLREQFLPRVDSCVAVFTLMRRSLLGERFLDPEVGGAADVELWHRLCTLGDVGYIREPLVRVRGRDQKSQFFLAEAKMMLRLLAAKERYLSFAGSESLRRQAIREWRLAADKSVVANLDKCFRAGNFAPLPDIERLAREWGNARSRTAVRLLTTAPAGVTRLALAGLRVSSRWWARLSPGRRLRRFGPGTT